MDSASSSLLLLLLLCLTSSLISAAPPSAATAEAQPAASATATGKTLSLKDACSKAKFPDLCESSIQSVAPDAKALDYRTALLHAISAVRVKIEDCLHKATNNKDSASQTPPAELSYCVSDLNDATDDIEKATVAVKNNDEATAIANLDSLGNNISSCRDELVPIKDDADEMYELLENCWSLYNVIWP